MQLGGAAQLRNQDGIVRPIDFFFVGLFFLLIIGGVIYFFRSNPTADPAGQLQSVIQPYNQVEQSQSVYTSTLHGISLLYPRGWEHEVVAEVPVANVNHMVEFRSSQATEAMIQVYIVDADSSDQALEESGIINSGRKLQYNQVLFDSRPGYTYSVDAGEDAMRATIMEHRTEGQWIIVLQSVPGNTIGIEEAMSYDAYVLIQESIRSFSGE